MKRSTWKTAPGMRGLGSSSLALVLAAGMSLAAMPVPAAPSKDEGVSQEDMHWSWKIAAGKAIEIKGVNGAIHARRSLGDKVEVRAWKRARHSDPSEVHVEFVEHAGGVTVCAVYPGKGNRCEPGEGGHMNTRNNDTAVEFEVLVPAGVGLVARNVNGAVEAESLEGPIEAHTVNGHVDVSTTQRAEASTVNGSISARMGRTGSDPLDFHTVNGSITLELGGEVNADLRASTVNGGIETDFPITVNGSIGRHRIEGTLGKGGTPLRLETVNGSIKLRKVST